MAVPCLESSTLPRFHDFRKRTPPAAHVVAACNMQLEFCLLCVLCEKVRCLHALPIAILCGLCKQSQCGCGSQ